MKAFANRHYIADRQVMRFFNFDPKNRPKKSNYSTASNGLDSLQFSYFFKFYKFILHPNQKEFNIFLIVLFQQKHCLNAVNVVFILVLPNFCKI